MCVVDMWQLDFKTKGPLTVFLGKAIKRIKMDEQNYG